MFTPGLNAYMRELSRLSRQIWHEDLVDKRLNQREIVT